MTFGDGESQNQGDAVIKYHLAMAYAKRATPKRVGGFAGRGETESKSPRSPDRGQYPRAGQIGSSTGVGFWRDLSASGPEFEAASDCQGHREPDLLK